MTYASPENEHWYVAATEGPRTALVLGLYANHSEAAAHVERARLHVLRAGYRDATFATWGTARTVTTSPRLGRLNGTLGLT